MDATVRSYATGGLALMASSVIAVTPIAPPPDLHLSSAAVRLASGAADLDPGGLANIPINLFHDFVNIPYNELQAMGLYADALGAPGAVGMDPAGPDQYGVPYAALEPYDGSNPILAPIGPDHDLVPVGVAGTGSYWMESLGNTWGWDEGNYGQLDGIANMIVPFPQFEQPFADELQAIAMAEIVADPGPGVGAENLGNGEFTDAQACPFACSDVLGYLGGWFSVPLKDLLNGYTLPDDIYPDSQPLSWSGQTIQLDPSYPFTNFFDSLTADPSTNPIEIPTLEQFADGPGKLFQDIFIDEFNPFYPNSFLYWGAPILYSVPSVLAGMVTNLTNGAVPNPFDIPAAGAETVDPEPVGLDNIVPGLAELGKLPGSLAQGFEYLANGLSEYFDPAFYPDTAGSAEAGTLSADLSGLLDSSALPDLSSSLGELGTNLTQLFDDPLALLGV